VKIIVGIRWLPPCCLCEPLGGGGYSKEEYAMMERDRGKYLLYAAALREAIKVSQVGIMIILFRFIRITIPRNIP